MIANFKNTKPNIALSDFECALSSYTFIKNMYFVDPAFYTNSEDDFIDVTFWYNQIGLGNVTPIFDAKDIEDKSDENITYIGIQDKEVGLFKGKYKFTAYFNYNEAIYKKLLKLDNKNGSVYIQDKNRNMYGILDGISIFGIYCDFISVEKLQFGTGEPSGIKVYITFNPSQIADVKISETQFDSHNLINFPIENEYTITDITYSAALQITVTVEDEFGAKLTGLVIGDFIVTDTTFGSQTLSGFSESSPGEYTFSCNRIMTSGTIYIAYDYTISETYSFTQYAAVYSFIGALTDATLDGYDQKSKSTWTFTTIDPVSVGVADYQVDSNTPYNTIEFNSYTGLGTQTIVMQSAILSLILTDDTDYVVDIFVGSDIPVGHTSQFFFEMRYASGKQSSIMPIIDTTDEFDSITIGHSLVSINVPDQGNEAISCGIGFISETPAASDYTNVVTGFLIYKRI